jgi:Coenzyme PQQ synthesis protein D (PqqD)
MNNSLSKRSIVVVTDSQVSSEFMDDEMVILDVYQGVYYVLNALGTRIWSLIQTPRPAGELIDILLEEYDVDADRCTREVFELLQELATRRLIEVRSETD